MENLLSDHVWEIILARLPLKSLPTSKLVCKKWKSMVESPFFRKLFLSHHQNSHPSWSLLRSDSRKEVISHYGCEVWGLPRSLGSYISSFLQDKFSEDDNVRVVSYTDVGLILIELKYRAFYVANPISRQCVEIPLPPHDSFRDANYFRPSGLATRVENGFVVGYKIVLVKRRYVRKGDVVNLIVYSSETGLWSFQTLRSPRTLSRPAGVDYIDPVCLNGNLYWLGCSMDRHQVIVAHDFFAESDQCRVLPFPDSEKTPNFRRACLPSQGFLTYINADRDDDDLSLDLKLRVWRLESDEWQIVSKISLACINTRFDYFPLAPNPSDATTWYLQSNTHTCLASANLLKGKFGLHNNLERSGSSTLSFDGEWTFSGIDGLYPIFSIFILPPWLYQIPSPPLS